MRLTPSASDLPEKLIKFSSLSLLQKEKMIETSLKIIANGFVSVVIDCSEAQISR